MKPFKKLIHVGCGAAGREQVMLEDFRGDDWMHIRVDVDPEVDPDVVDDIRVLRTFDHRSVDGVYASHVLEHLHPNEAMAAIKSFMRVLRPGGIIFAMVPDIGLACEWVARGAGLDVIYESPGGPITPIDMIYGYRPYTLHNPYQVHRCGYTVDSLKGLFVESGCTKVKVRKGPGFDLWALAEKHLENG